MGLRGCHPGISKVIRLSGVAEILELIIRMLVVGGDGGKSCYPKDLQQLLHSTVNKHSQLVQSTLCRCLEKVVDLHCFFFVQSVYIQILRFGLLLEAAFALNTV